ncbi:type II toxin-antitoxin system RatA family toxin [Burkholderiaceae bacterium FT117]|uniref:type II toxin-antitoxin system RatA family toxin n=1 Tax=Zeimonas sediminis TaxID=2944268 RepID=UPI002342E1FB|nr:type II toxin-antitoxin system RatA family toxin [Zeimonas sediminis]MCM5569206.1 type II toxin-antitoxin system RatA family toxin [Zeimonas sediminis]
MTVRPPHTVRKSVLVPYPAERMFSLVERVEDYPKFLPWCGGTEVERHEDGSMTATVRIDFRGIRQSFTTRNTHEPGRRIEMALREGPFTQLHGEWRFTPLREDACKVEFVLEYRFAGGLLGRVLEPVFDHIARSFVDAFVRRAEHLHALE